LKNIFFGLLESQRKIEDVERGREDRGKSIENRKQTKQKKTKKNKKKRRHETD